MAPLCDFHQGKKNIYTVCTVNATPAHTLYALFKAQWCYPISHTKYRFSSQLGWSDLVSVIQEEL